MVLFLTLSLLSLSYSLASRLMDLNPSPLSPAMKNFMIRVARENYQEKIGFLFLEVNEVEPEYSDFAVKQLSVNNTVVILNGGQLNMEVKVNPNHFKFALLNPETDLSHSGKIFKNIRVTRARVVLILTKKPLFFVVDFILNAYYMVQSINVVIAYEDDGEIVIMTYNPYSAQRTQRVTDELFYEKTQNLHGSTVNGLLTFNDRTKIIKRASGYQGKDFIALDTILRHLNGRLEVVTLDNFLLNPWLESSFFPAKNILKTRLLNSRNISVLVKSEHFSIDDEILDNLYPHAQNDLSGLVRKSPEITLGESLVRLYRHSAFFLILGVTLIVITAWSILRKLSKTVNTSQSVVFNVARILFTNNINLFPSNSLERIIVSSWILTAFIINTFSQSKITSFMALRWYYPEINTIDELLSSGIPVYSIPIDIDEIRKKYVGTEYEWYSEALLLLTTNEALMEHMIYNLDVDQLPALLIEHDIALYISRRRKYHLLKESIIPNYQSYKVVHNSPLLPVLNKNLRRLEEGGFIELWTKDMIFNATLEGFLTHEEYDETRSPSSLTVEDLHGWFVVLLLGESMALCSFILEVLIHKKKKSHS